MGVSATILTILLIVGQGWASSVDFDLSPRKITVGDPIDVTMAVVPPAGSKVVWPSPEQFAPAEVIKTDTSGSTESKKTVHFTLSLFEPGRKDLQHLPVLLLSANGTDTIWVEPGAVEVGSISTEADTSLKDIRPPMLIPWTFKEMLPYIIGALIAIAAAAGGYYLWRKAKLRRGEIPVYVPPPPPPDVMAMRKLEDLRIRKLWQDGHIKEYHSELTDIVKEYIGGRFEFNALELTTEELLAVRSRWATSDDSYSPIRRMLTIADLVKFAKFKPEPHDHEKSLDHAFTFVKATRPVQTGEAA